MEDQVGHVGRTAQLEQGDGSIDGEYTASGQGPRWIDGSNPQDENPLDEKWDADEEANGGYGRPWSRLQVQEDSIDLRNRGQDKYSIDNESRNAYRGYDADNTLPYANSKGTHIQNEYRSSSQLWCGEKEKDDCDRNEECRVGGYQNQPLHLLLDERERD